VAELSGEVNARLSCFMTAGDNGRDSSSEYRYSVIGGLNGTGGQQTFGGAFYFYPGELALRSYEWSDNRFGAALQVTDGARIWSSESANPRSISPPPAFSFVLTGLEVAPGLPSRDAGREINYVAHGTLDAILPPYAIPGAPLDGGSKSNLTVRMTF
jgi:hypothetical protein